MSASVSAAQVPSRLPIILKAMAKATLVSFAKSGALILVSLLAGLLHPLLGTAVVFLGSLHMLMGQYKKPWRLNWLTGLCSPFMAFLSIIIQVWFFASLAPMPSAPAVLAMLGFGFLLGLWRGLVHKVWQGDKGLMAERTSFYLLVWAACFGFTQVLGMLKLSGLMPFALMSNCFSVAMLSTVMVVLLFKGLLAKSPFAKAAQEAS